MDNISILVGDIFYHDNEEVKIVRIHENGIVTVLAKEKNGKHYNYDVPVSDLEREKNEIEIFAF